jgi:hypothetical protein
VPQRQPTLSERLIQSARRPAVPEQEVNTAPDRVVGGFPLGLLDELESAFEVDGVAREAEKNRRAHVPMRQLVQQRLQDPGPILDRARPDVGVGRLELTAPKSLILPERCQRDGEL